MNQDHRLLEQPSMVQEAAGIIGELDCLYGHDCAPRKFVHTLKLAKASRLITEDGEDPRQQQYQPPQSGPQEKHGIANALP